MVSDTEHRIALFIDFENLVTNTGISPATFDLQPAIDRLLEKGKVVFRRAYCDWSRFREAPQRLHDFAVELQKTRGEIPQIAREVVSSLLSRATGPLNPSLIKETIVRNQPDFDERDQGFSTFSRLLQAMEREGLLRRQQINGRQWYVLPPDAPASSPASAEDEAGDVDASEEA